MDVQGRQHELQQQFAEAIADFEKGIYSSRGLARRVEKLTTPEELKQLDNEMLNHTYWVARHLLHQPACWAPSSTELSYLHRCLQGEEQFVMDIAESFRQ